MIYNKSVFKLILVLNVILFLFGWSPGSVIFLFTESVSCVTTVREDQIYSVNHFSVVFLSEHFRRMDIDVKRHNGYHSSDKPQVFEKSLGFCRFDWTGHPFANWFASSADVLSVCVNDFNELIGFGNDLSSDSPLEVFTKQFVFDFHMIFEKLSFTENVKHFVENNYLLNCF